MTAEFCVCCGEMIPEGRQVCPDCEHKVTQNKDAIRFFKTQIKRSKINLQGAQDRGDSKATANILRKIGIFEYVLVVLHGLPKDDD